MLARLFKPKTPEPIPYETARDTAQSPDPAARMRLAVRPDTHKEVLYYLAGDAETPVRRAIAANASTPIQANALLATDADEEVRAAVAQKVGRLLPGLEPGQTEKIRDLALRTLEVLAHDQVTRVREVLSQELKNRPDAPREVVLALAHDLAATVAVPILEYSPLLGDADLVEIIANGQLQERLSAIAKRPSVSGDVADAIVATLDVPAVAALLANPSAQIREDTLDAIVDNAAGIEAWHQPLVVRTELSVRAIRRISGFVASAMIGQLAGRHGLPEDLQRELRQAVKQRLNEPEEPPSADRVKQLFDAGKLDEEMLLGAAERGDRAFAMAALSLLSKLPAHIVGRAMETRSAKAITAICWKAGLSMRTAMRVQAKVGQIPAPSMLNARGGFDYPLSERELEDQLRLLIGA